MQMEAVLEDMLVGGWFQGERSKLLLRVESVERELSCMISGRIHQQQAYEAKKEELSSRATREEMLRKKCEKRVQDLEHEVLLLSEQLRASGKALQRERANNTRSRQYAELSSGSVPTPRTGCDGRRHDTDGEWAVAGQLGVVGRLLEENLRLGSVVRQLQSEGRRLRRRRQEHVHPTRVRKAATNSDLTRKKGVGEPCDCPAKVETAPKDYDLKMALSKIEALTGVIRAQEEIETLLGRELDELKTKHARNRESVWRLLTRWSRVLAKRGYGVERDARSEGVLHELQHRIKAQDGDRQDRPPLH